MHIVINGTAATMELDTGASVSVMNAVQFHRLTERAVPIQPYRGKPLTSYSGQLLHVVGEAQVHITYGRQSHTLPLVIVDGNKVIRQRGYARNFRRHDLHRTL